MKRVFCLLLILCNLFLKAQEHQAPPIPEYISVTTNLVQYLLKEPNVSISYRKNLIEFGVNFGLVQPANIFEVNPLANGQYTWPGTVYNGEALRLSVKYFFISNTYLCFQGVYKYMWYNNVSFLDDYNDEAIYYTMNEKDNVLGAELLIGHEWDIDRFINIDLFCGAGFRCRFRTYDVLTLTNSYSRDLTLGPHTEQLMLPAFVIGLKMGFNYPIKKKSGLVDSKN